MSAARKTSFFSAESHMKYLLYLISESYQANNVTSEVFSVKSVFWRMDSIYELKDKLEASIHFRTKRLKFIAANGLMEIHLQLLTSIAGVITTYLVILGSNLSN